MAEGLAYLAQPARLGGRDSVENRERVVAAVTARDLTVVHPFEAFPYDRFEGSPTVGREKAMSYCCRLIDICEAGFVITGISEGTLLEARYFLAKWPERQLINLIEEFDPDWQQYRDTFMEDRGLRPALERLVG